MQVLIIAAVVVVLAGLLLVSLLANAFDLVAKSVADTKKTLEQKKTDRRARAEADSASALAAAEQAEIEAYRSENPVRIVGIPNPDAYRRSFAVLDDFAVAANVYRPSLPETLDCRFRAYKFPSHLFDLARPHPASLSNTEPRKVTLTAEDILMGGGTEMAQFYGRAKTDCGFPCEPPQYRHRPDAVPQPKPSFPNVKVPPNVRVRLVTRDDVEIEGDDGLQGKAYRNELEKVASLNSQAALLHQTLEQRYALASEAFELMEIYLGDLTLKWRAAEAALLREFEGR